VPVLLARLRFTNTDMRLNILTTRPIELLSILQEMYPQAHVEHTPVCPEIHDYEISEEEEPVVYSLEGLMELSSSYGISPHNIRIY